MPTASLLLAAALAPADAPTPPPDAAVSDAGELQGEWEVVGCDMEGGDETPRFKAYRWAFTGTSAALITARGGPLWTTTVRVDPAAAMPVIDRERPDHSVSLGVYRRTGDELLWAAELIEERRPSSFDPAPGVIVWTLRRVRK
jgi:uncharacterized protein (TIGR03067 family)